VKFYVLQNVNVTKYTSQKYKIYRYQMCSLKLQMQQNLFSAGALPCRLDPAWELMTLSQTF